MKKDWLSMRAQAQKDKMPMPEAYGWPYIQKWAEKQLNSEIIDEELTARQLMLSGKIIQGDKSITDFINRMTRASRKIPNITDMDRIIWFLNGISEPLSHVCVSDVKGRTWTSFESLRQHALAKEMELNSRLKSTKTQKSQVPFGIRKARYNQERSRPDHSIPNNSHHSLAYTRVQEGGDRMVTNGSKDRDNKPTERPLATERTVSTGIKFPGPPEDRCRLNRNLSNTQANWLCDKGLCLFCGQKFHGIKDNKAVECRHKSKHINFSFLKKEGMPRSNFPQ
jgi:hypothetical protein